MNNRFCHISIFLIAVIMMITAVSSCSVKKNTAQTRWWHSFTARYNIYYNASQAYIDASLEKEKGNKDNYTEMLPLFTVGNKQSREIGKGNFDRAIEKCQKAIQLHSINKRPEWTKNRKKTERDIEWLNRKEYNPFLWRAWMLMGRSQFYQGKFDEAASTFNYMCRLYRTQPAIYGKARAWLAKCYIEQDWIYDAEDIIRNMQRDSIDWRAQKDWDYTFADYYLHSGDMQKSAEYLRKVVKHEKRTMQRAREYFLLGQVEAQLGNKQAAYNAYRKVLHQNPPYEVAFNARIAMTEVLANTGQSKKMIARLKRMASNDNNKEYLDQVYYAIGNIYLAAKDTMNAISAYEKGNKEATRSGIEKGVLLLHLGDLYWAKEKYGDAGRCYGEAIGLLDRDRPDYELLSERSKVLDELVPYTDAIQLQDSLQALANMSEPERNKAIDRVIEDLKKKEKEEKKREAEANAAQQQQRGGNTNSRPTPSAPGQQRQNGATWYFYNPTAVQQGKLAFERQWGKRENADNWQRMNKTVVSSPIDIPSEETAENDVPSDSLIADADTIAESKPDSIITCDDPHKREYYLAQIPFTDEQLQASNDIIMDGLFHSGIIFKDKLDNLALSEKAFYRLLEEFPSFEPMDEVFYHLFLLHSRKGEKDIAESYVAQLKNYYPDSKLTVLLTDPYFEENARFGTHIEDSLYAATYNAFLNDNYAEVMGNTAISDTRFELGAHRDKFLFVSALSQLNSGKADDCLERLQKLLKEFPESEVSKMAGMIINGVNEGRKLQGAHFSIADVWDRRAKVLEDTEVSEERTFSDETDVPYHFMLVYEPDSLNENQLLFQLAKFNFTNFIVRNFDMEISDDGGVHRMMVSGFRSFDETRTYARVLFQNEAIASIARQCRPVIISSSNLQLLGEQYSYNDYQEFYEKTFLDHKSEKEYMLYEPDAVEDKTTKDIHLILPSENVAPEGVKPVEPKEEGEEEEDNDNTITLGNTPEETVIDDTIITTDEPEPQKQADEEVIILDNNDQDARQNEEEIIIVDESDQQKEDEDIILVEDEQTTQEDDEDFIIDDGEEIIEDTDETIDLDDFY